MDAIRDCTDSCTRDAGKVANAQDGKGDHDMGMNSDMGCWNPDAWKEHELTSLDKPNLLTCTARDVIAYSVALHPSLMAEKLYGFALHHWYSAEVLLHGDAVAARKHEQACREAARAVERGDVLAVMIADRNAAFVAAARLQCIPRQLWSGILARQDAADDAALAHATVPAGEESLDPLRQYQDARYKSRTD